jgi:hypothetical protein
MRKFALATLVLLAACSGEKAPSGGSEAGKGAIKLEPGQWETTVEMLSMTMADKSLPMAKAGNKTTVISCITQADVDKPAANMFAGNKSDCKYDNFYMSKGRLSASMSCKQQGMNGNVVSNIDGKYSGTSYEANVDTASYTGQGDFKMSAKVTGRRLGATCAPEDAKTAPPAT